MVSRNEINSVQFRQEAGYCVIASYAVAIKPFTGEFDVDEYFSDYCKHFNVTNADFRAGYLYHFHEIECKNSPGNKIMVDLHHYSSQAIFESARNVCGVEYISDGKSAAAQIESELRSNKKVLANLFVSRPSDAANNLGAAVGMASNHNITVGVDEQGLYIFDVNKDQGLLTTNFTSINEIGEIGDAILFTAK